MTTVPTSAAQSEIEYFRQRIEHRKNLLREAPHAKPLLDLMERDLRKQEQRLSGQLK